MAQLAPKSWESQPQSIPDARPARLQLAAGQSPIASPAHALMQRIETSFLDEYDAEKADIRSRMGVILGVSSLLWVAIIGCFMILLG